MTVIHPCKRFIREYGAAVLLAVLCHGLILGLLLNTTFDRPAQQVPPVPITSFLYQPPQPTPVVATAVESGSAEISVPEDKPAVVLPERTFAGNNNKIDAQPAMSPDLVTPNTEQRPVGPLSANPSNGETLVQRALNRAAAASPAVIEKDAANSYQQFLQRQQPRLTVDKKHWPLSENPAQQVIAQMNDGQQIVRTKQGCLIGDPEKDGFEALMAAKFVPCGDEVSTSELLKQALDKHIKR